MLPRSSHPLARLLLVLLGILALLLGGVPALAQAGPEGPYEDEAELLDPYADPDPAEGEILCVEGEPCWEEDDALPDPYEDEPLDPYAEDELLDPYAEDEALLPEDAESGAEEEGILCVEGEPCWDDEAAEASEWDPYLEDGTETPEDLLDANEVDLDALYPEERRYCAKRLPDQMPRTCRVRDVPVPDAMADFYAYFRTWVRRCVHESRVDEHMTENDATILEIWRQVQGRDTVRVHVHVTAFPFVDQGERCLGVESMTFSLERQPTPVEIEDAGIEDVEPAPTPDFDPEEDQEDIAEGFADVVATADPDRLDEAARDAADCFDLDTDLLSAAKRMLKQTFLQVPLSKLEGRYECLYDAFTAGYPVGVAAGLLELPEPYVRNHLMFRRTGPPPGFFDCQALSMDAADQAIHTGYGRVRSLGPARRKGQYDLVLGYMQQHEEEANRRAGPRVRDSVIGVDGEERAHPDLVYLTAWAVRGVYGIERPRNPMSPSSLRDCVEGAVKDAVESYAKEKASGG